MLASTQCVFHFPQPYLTLPNPTLFYPTYSLPLLSFSPPPLHRPASSPAAASSDGKSSPLCCTSTPSTSPTYLSSSFSTRPPMSPMCISSTLTPLISTSSVGRKAPSRTSSTVSKTVESVSLIVLKVRSHSIPHSHSRTRIRTPCLSRLTARSLNSGRDVIFELVRPDATSIDVGKWPDTNVQSETGVLRTVRPSKSGKAARSLKPALSMSNGKSNATHSTHDVHSEFIAYSPSADVKPEVSDDDLNSPLHQQLPQQQQQQQQKPSTSDTISIVVPPPPGKKWSRRSSPDRIFMNQALNDILRAAGMPIPRQKDDASRLPWSSIPLFLAQHGLYISNFPEANLPWVYSVENIQAKNREDWIDRVDWKSSPSQRAYKGLVAALRRGDIQIKRRPDGRDVIFEVKDTEGRTYDSTLGLSDAWKQLNMYGDGRKLISVPGVAGTSADGMADGHRPGMGRLEDEYEMMDLEERGSDSSGSGPQRGHRRHHTNGKDPSPRHADNEHPISQQGRRHGGGSPPSSSWPPTVAVGYSQSQAHPNYSALGRPGPQQHRSSGSPLSYHPTVNDPEFMSRGRPHHTDHTSLARYHLSSSNSRRGTPYSRHSSPKFNGGCAEEGVVDLPPLDLSRGEREIQREKEEIGHGHGLGTTLPPIKDSQHPHNVKLETVDRLLSPPYSPPARLPPVLQDREYERDRESRRERDEEMRDGEAAYNTPPRTASHSSGPPLPPRIPRQYNTNPPPPDHNHQTQTHSQPNPTHLPHPQGSSTPFWSPPEKTWKLSLTPELLGSLPPVSHPDIYWDTARGRWILVSGSESGSPPPAYWSISQGAWVLDFTGGFGLRA